LEGLCQNDSMAGTLYKNGVIIETAKDAAMALGLLAGKYAEILFAFGLLNASLFSAAILPLSTAYSACEAFGWASSISRSFMQAPIFFKYLYCYDRFRCVDHPFTCKLLGAGDDDKPNNERITFTNHLNCDASIN